MHHSCEFWKFLGILLVARLEGVPGRMLWKNGGQTEGYKTMPNMEQDIMPQYRFKEIKTYIVHAWASVEKREEGDHWWMVSDLIEGFNNNRRYKVQQSSDKLADKLMSAF